MCARLLGPLAARDGTWSPPTGPSLVRSCRVEPFCRKCWDSALLLKVQRSDQGKWSLRSDSNRRPAHYECAALPTELPRQGRRPDVDPG